MYACGPTVYNYAHIGNLRTYIFEDILRRVRWRWPGIRSRIMWSILPMLGILTSDADTGEDKIEEGSRRTGEEQRGK